MVKCSNCGYECNSQDEFCVNCGSKVNASNPNSNSAITGGVYYNQPSFFDRYGLIILGYLVLIGDLFCIIAGCAKVRIVNSDRLALYPFLSFMLAVFASFNIFNNSEDKIHALIITVIALVLLVIFSFV